MDHSKKGGSCFRLSITGTAASFFSTTLLVGIFQGYEGLSQNRTSLMLFKFIWCQMSYLFKYAVEMLYIVESAFQADINDGFIAV